MRLTCFCALLFLAPFIPSPASAQQCLLVDHASEYQVELNSFWGTAIPVCQLEPGMGGASALPADGVVVADQDWLDEMADRHGNWAATGILAHEWGHMVQGPVSGTAAELQVDCLAGVFLGGMGLPPETIREFAEANFFNADAQSSLGGHGTSQQRVTAAWRGYSLYNGDRNPAVLVAICPLSAF